jgi:hypothetical protein
MTYVPETCLEDIKLQRKKSARGRPPSTGLNDVAQCVAGEQLKQQYDSALEEWRRQLQPQLHPLVEGALKRQVLQQREEALTGRNAAANRMYLHRASCAICRRRR